MGSTLDETQWQPPSGGCVLKHALLSDISKQCEAAAFGRLCVETTRETFILAVLDAAAAFGRLCVETTDIVVVAGRPGAAAFGRLCVETQS